MQRVTIIWVFVFSFFAVSNSYVFNRHINTDHGYCEYDNGVLIPVNDYAFNEEKCEWIYCNPGRLNVRGCGTYRFSPYPGLNCTMVRGKGLNCCQYIPKCKVVFKFPGNNSYPEDWIIEDDGTAEIFPPPLPPPVEEAIDEDADIGDAEELTFWDTTGENTTCESTSEEDSTGELIAIMNLMNKAINNENATYNNATNKRQAYKNATVDETSEQNTTVENTMYGDIYNMNIPVIDTSEEKTRNRNRIDENTTNETTTETAAENVNTTNKHTNIEYTNNGNTSDVTVSTSTNGTNDNTTDDLFLIEINRQAKSYKFVENF